MTDNTWLIVVDIDLRTYQDNISTIKADLLLVEQQTKVSTSISELQHIETLLQQLDIKLSQSIKFCLS